MNAKPIGRNALAFIAITMAIDMAGVGIILPVLPDLIRELAPVSLSDAAGVGGLLVFAYAGMQFFCAPIAGNLGDRFGRRPVLLLALAGLAVDYLIMAFAGTLWLLVAGRVIAGVAGSTWAVANAYVADIAGREARARSFGVVSAAGAAGLILGPAIGGTLGAIDIRAPFYAAALLTAANVAYGWFVLPETLAPENRRPFDWRRANPVGGLANVRTYPRVVGILAAFFLMHMANQSLAHIWAFFVKEKFAWNTFETGISITFYAITVAVAQGGLTGPVVKRFGEARAVYFGLASGLLGFIMLAFAREGWHMYAAMIVGACAGFVTPSMQSLMTRAAPPNAQGELQGAVTSTLALTVFIGPLLMTQLFKLFTDAEGIYFPGAPFLASAGVFVATAVLFTVVFPRRDRRNDGAPAAGRERADIADIADRESDGPSPCAATDAGANVRS